VSTGFFESVFAFSFAILLLHSLLVCFSFFTSDNDSGLQRPRSPGGRNHNGVVCCHMFLSVVL